MQNIERDLAKRIEQVIQAFLIESRTAAAAAVDRSFNVDVAQKGLKAGAKPKGAKRRPGLRRPAEQIKSLREAFLRAVQEQPGETMQTLAARLGQPSAVLCRYAVRLRDEGLIRTVGKLQSMRYFPMTTGTMTTPNA